MSQQPIYTFGGAGPVMHLAVANGFPPAVYAPLLQPFTVNYGVICLPPRALWPGQQPPAELHDWQMIADDLLAGLWEYDLSNVIAVGHSFGGIASLLAVIAEPGRFRALCLLDPTILPPHTMDYMAQMQASGDMSSFPLMQAALRRRRRFDNAQTLYDYCKSKMLFADWPDETIRLYAEFGTRLAADGSVELSWSPEWEAYYFSTLYTRTWDELPKLPPNFPVLVVRGADSDTFLPEDYDQVRRLLPGATCHEIPGHGHLFPQTAPDETRHIMADWLAALP
jgi:pimeloyl-ACP methyl ester carboxylesterase